jgi:hypothetical protein
MQAKPLMLIGNSNKRKKERRKNLPPTKKTNLNFFKEKKINAHLESCNNLTKKIFFIFFH